MTWQQIENPSYSMQWIGDDDDFFDVQNTDSLINTTSDGKQFHFHGGNIDSLMKCFDYQLIKQMNM